MRRWERVQKKQFGTKTSLLGKYIEGEVVFSIANIFVGKSQSIICVAKEILVRGNNRRRKGVILENTLFGEEVEVTEMIMLFLYFKGNPLKYIFFVFLKDNLCEFHLREQFFCRNTLINPVLIVRKLQYDYRAF